MMSINVFATAGVNLIAPRPQCFLLRDQSIIDTGRPSAFCSRCILSCFVMKFFLRSCVGKSFFNCAKAALVKRPPWVSSSARNVTSFRTGVLTSCRTTRFLAGVAWDSLGFTTRVAMSFRESCFFLANVTCARRARKQGQNIGWRAWLICNCCGAPLQLSRVSSGTPCISGKFKQRNYNV